MSEQIPGPEEIAAKLAEQFKRYPQEQHTLAEVLGRDEKDSERGPIIRMVRSVAAAPGDCHEEVVSFHKNFTTHFGDASGRYRLVHIMKGSTPPIGSDLFDAEGEWSIAAKLQQLSEKYRVGHVDAEAA